MASGSESRRSKRLRIHPLLRKLPNRPVPSEPPTRDSKPLAGPASAPGSAAPTSSVAPAQTTTDAPLQRRLTELKDILKELKPSLDGLPPVQSAIGGLEECIEYMQTKGQNQLGYENILSGLIRRVGLLAADLVKSEPRGVPHSIVNVARAIEEQTNDIKDRQAQLLTRGPAIANEGEETADISSCVWDDIQEQRMDTRLEKLIPVHESYYNAALPICVTKRGACTENTRVDLLDGAWTWTRDINGAKIYWLNGMAGTGKTTIAYTMCNMLQAVKRLAASFFCSRNSPECRDVNKIVPTIAYQLGRYSNPYRQALCRALDEDPDVARRDISTQFEHLISKPLAKIGKAMPGNVVVVIDALDECVDALGTKSVLDMLLRHAGNLPLRFFVTSRPESTISERMMGSEGAMRSILWLHDIEKSLVQADIKTYLVEALRSVQFETSELDALANKAGCLFIFAATAVRYIAPDRGSVNHRQRLENILELHSSRGNKSYKDIDNLYITILSNALDDATFEEEELAPRRQVLWTVACARKPLRMLALVELLNLRDVQAVETAIQPLQSVLHISEITGAVSALHASFPDFLLDRERAGRFYCNEIVQSANLAEYCFQLMGRLLRFNICGLETSHMLDQDVPNLKDRVDGAISTGLFYSCKYWGDHLAKCTPSPPLFSLLGSFMEEHLLFWMEVLNLKGCISHGDGVLGQVSVWLSRENSITDLQDFLYDARNFLVIFASHPTSLSTPHLYISALPFTAKKSHVWTNYWPRMQGLVRVESKLMDQRGSLVLATWDVGCEVYSIATSSDGKRIVSGSGAFGGDGEVSVWDVASGARVLGPLKGHERPVHVVRLSPDGTRIVSGSVDRTICIWDAIDGRLVTGPLHGHTNAITSLSFSSDSSYIASGSHDRTIQMWDSYSGAPLGNPLKGHQASVMSVAFSPDSKQLASGSSDCLVRLWDLRTRADPRIQLVFEGHTGPVWSIAYSPNGLRLVSGSKDCTIRMWDVTNGTLLASPFVGHTGPVTSISFSPNGSRIASGSHDKTICVWEAEGGTLLADPLKVHSKKIRSVIFTADGTRILSGSEDCTIRVCDVRHKTASPTESSRSEASRRIHSVALSPDGTHVASGSRDGMICLWNSHSSMLVTGPFKAHHDSVNSLAFSPDGARIVSGCSEGTPCTWDSFTGDLLATLVEVDSGWAKSVVFSPDGNQIAGCNAGGAWIWSSHSGRSIARAVDHQISDVSSVAYSPDGAYLIAGAKSRRSSYGVDSVVQLWDIHRRPFPLQLWASILLRHSITCLAFSPDGTRIVCGSSDSAILLLDASDGRVLHGPFQNYTGRITSIAFSPDGSRIAIGWRDGHLVLWDVQSRRTVGGLLGDYTDRLVSVAFSPSGSRMFSGSSDGMVRFWDLEAVTSPHAIYDYHLDMSNDGWLTHWNERLILWVPADLREHFKCPTLANPSIIAEKCSSFIDNSTLHMGNEWHNCYRPSPSPVV